MRGILRKLRFGLPDKDAEKANKREDEHEKKDINRLKVLIRVLEAENGIPPRREKEDFGNSHS